MKDKLLIIRNQLKMGHRLSFAEAMLLQRAIDVFVCQAGNSPVIPDGYVMVPKEPTQAMCAAFNDSDYGRKSLRERYVAMLAAAPQSPGSEPATVPGKWIPVSEQMPEAGGDMIVFTDGIVMSGVSYAKKKGFYIQALEYDDDEPVDSVTHWMPLPAAPQEVNHG